MTLANLDGDVSLVALLGYVAAMIMPAFLGAAIAMDVQAVTDRWDPFAHWDGIVEAAPLGLAGAALVLLLVSALYEIEFIRLIPIPPIIYAGLLARWVKQTP
ncbi:MAG: hypothetical protein JO220_02815 [Hyphomicrobiales bacterium]|nr:hypothetical protein [Hyphomicrobiales bacterium]